VNIKKARASKQKKTRLFRVTIGPVETQQCVLCVLLSPQVTVENIKILSAAEQGFLLRVYVAGNTNYVAIHVKCQKIFFSADFKQIWTLSTDFRKSPPPPPTTPSINLT
jgi:hypothetical protein